MNNPNNFKLASTGSMDRPAMELNILLSNVYAIGHQNPIVNPIVANHFRQGFLTPSSPSSREPSRLLPGVDLSYSLSNNSFLGLPTQLQRGEEVEEVTVMPCRARGMPVDHNCKSAYFYIHPKSTKHGSQLVCSNELCRREGVKFLYCAFCGVPVAKKSFATRHSHKGEVECSNVGTVPLAPKESSGTDIHKHHILPTLKDSTQEEDAVLRQKAKSTTAGDLHRKNRRKSESDPNEALSKRGRYIEENVPERSSTHKTLSNTNLDISEEWGRLLFLRPTGDRTEEMSSWLMKVLSVSSKFRPEENYDESNMSPSSCINVDSDKGGEGGVHSPTTQVVKAMTK